MMVRFVKCYPRRQDFCCGSYEKTAIEDHERMFTHQINSMIWPLEKMEEISWSRNCRKFEVDGSLPRR